MGNKFINIMALVFVLALIGGVFYFWYQNDSFKKNVEISENSKQNDQIKSDYATKDDSLNKTGDGKLVPDDDWQVYKNDKLGIKINHSKDIIVSRERGMITSFKSYKDREFWCDDDPECILPVVHVQKVLKKDMDTYIANTLKQKPNGIVVEKDVVLSDKKAKKFMFPSMANNEGYLIELEEDMFIIYAINPTKKELNLDNIIDFNSIEFTK